MSEGQRITLTLRAPAACVAASTSGLAALRLAARPGRLAFAPAVARAAARLVSGEARP